MSETNDRQEPRTAQNSNPKCEMPECVGSRDDDTHAVRDPSDELLEMCDSCLDDGWRGVVEVLD